jgi:dTDP-4-dehydrorhamnose 3,5-epimerase
VKYDDPAIGIEWPEVGELTISEKDQNQPNLADIAEEFNYTESE